MKCAGWFFIYGPSKMKNELQPTRATLKKKQCKTIPPWLSKFLHLSSENGEEEFKKLPVQ